MMTHRADVDRGVSAEEPAQEVALQPPRGRVRHQRHGSDERFRSEPDAQVQDGETARNNFNPTHVLAAVHQGSGPMHGCLVFPVFSVKPSVWYDIICIFLVFS